MYYDITACVGKEGGGGGVQRKCSSYGKGKGGGLCKILIEISVGILGSPMGVVHCTKHFVIVAVNVDVSKGQG